MVARVVIEFDTGEQCCSEKRWSLTQEIDLHLYAWHTFPNMIDSNIFWHTGKKRASG